MKPTCWGKGRLAIDRKSTRLNSNHTEIYTLSLHDALPIYAELVALLLRQALVRGPAAVPVGNEAHVLGQGPLGHRSEEHTSELQSHRDLHSFPTRRSSDLCRTGSPSPSPGPCPRPSGGSRRE